MVTKKKINKFWRKIKMANWCYGTIIKILSNKDNDYSLLLDVKFANYVNTNTLSEIAKQYNIDIGVQATEETNEFTQTIAVNKAGKIMIDDIIER